MFNRLSLAGFEVTIRNHAGAILHVDFPEVVAELEDALLDVSIPVEELIASGGGEAQSTQRLRRALALAGWPKHNFDFSLVVDGIERISTTHEIDHVRRHENGTIACELEWNNKDPFFDRDLENFQRLHAQSAVSVGIIITRGQDMQDALIGLVERCIIKHGCSSEADMIQAFGMKDRTARQRQDVQRKIAAAARGSRRIPSRVMPFHEAFAKDFVKDKFGQATTHWAKLESRISRGVGNPCPMVLIGLPLGVIVE